MPFEKGRKKTGGRQKGSGNPLKSIKDICAEKGFCFATKLVELAQGGDKQIAMQAVKEGMKYLYPQLKSHEIAGKDGQPIEVKDTGFKDEIVAQALQLINAKKL